MNNQYVIPLFVAGSLLLALFAFFLIAYLLVQKNKQNAYQTEKRQMVFDHQNKILRTKIEEQESTMDQISRELHDNIKSVLGFVQMSMYHISSMAADKELTVQIDRTNTMIGEVIDNLHHISHSLNSNFVKNIGLVETITKELENIKASKNITYNLEISGESFLLSPEKEIHIFRIAQEAFQNCMKHAKATNINFALSYTPDSFTMKISDNGIGFDKNKIHEMKGLGFLNMFQRARYVQGVLEVQSVPLHGSSVILTLNPNMDGLSN
jgi:two-component system, NarL family, sensor kinase